MSDRRTAWQQEGKFTPKLIENTKSYFMRASGVKITDQLAEMFLTNMVTLIKTLCEIDQELGEVTLQESQNNEGKQEIGGF